MVRKRVIHMLVLLVHRSLTAYFMHSQVPLPLHSVVVFVSVNVLLCLLHALVRMVFSSLFCLLSSRPRKHTTLYVSVDFLRKCSTFSSFLLRFFCRLLRTLCVCVHYISIICHITVLVCVCVHGASDSNVYNMQYALKCEIKHLKTVARSMSVFRRCWCLFFCLILA